MSTELPTVTIASSDKLLQKFVETDPESPYYESDQWTVSDPVPGVRIINTWQIYPNIWLTLTATEGGQYNIYRSMGIQSPVLVHAHDCEIYNIFYLDDGCALFCAADGWWSTADTGATWVGIAPWYAGYWMIHWPISGVVPVANAAAIVTISEGSWAIIAYARDRKIHRSNYPDGVWAESLDTSDLWADKWYPAIAGGPAGVLAGAGGKLVRTTDLGSSWQVVQEVAGIIKSIVISNQSRLPTFLITVESLTGESDNLFWTYDLGDSLVPELSRVGSIASVQSVTPTGTNEQQTSFIVLGKRTADGQQSYKIIGGGA